MDVFGNVFIWFLVQENVVKDAKIMFISQYISNITEYSVKYQRCKKCANLRTLFAEKTWMLQRNFEVKKLKSRFCIHFFAIKNCIVATDVRFFFKVWKIFTFVKNSPKNQVWSEKSVFFKYSMYKEGFLQSMNIYIIF